VPQDKQAILAAASVARIERIERTTMANLLPEGFLVRATSMDDLDAVLQLLTTCEIAEIGEAESSKEDLHAEWQAGGFNLATDSWVVIAPEGKIVAYAIVGARQHIRIQAFAQVHPEYRNKGIGTFLLLLTEEWELQQIPQAPLDARVVLGVDSGNLIGAVRGYQRAGMYVEHQYDRYEKELHSGIELNRQAVTV
jgi:GNAT superfamily N-acetyltransferase